MSANFCKLFGEAWRATRSLCAARMDCALSSASAKTGLRVSSGGTGRLYCIEYEG